MNRRERRAAARKSESASGSAGKLAALCEAGHVHLRAERYLDAQLCCRQALEIDSGYASAQHLMGLVSLHAGQHDLAVEWMIRAIRQEPNPEYLVSLGIVLQRSGRLEEALKTFDKAVKLKPDAPESWKHLGFVLEQMNRLDQALSSYQQAITLNPSEWEAADKSASLLFQSGRLEEALSCFNVCDSLRPDRPSTLHMRALTKFGLNRYEDAFADITRAQALDPNNADICNNVGGVLQRLRRDTEALPWFERALALRPNYLAAIMNKAGSLYEVHRFSEAFAVYQEAKAIDPGNANPDWSIALLHLLTGNFEAGWAGREVRWKAPKLADSPYQFPATPVAWETTDRRQDHPRACRRRSRRYNSVCALCADVGCARRESCSCRRRRSLPAAVGTFGRIEVSFVQDWQVP
jgi:tetratricopeptide (TPR) repeat protein